MTSAEYPQDRHRHDEDDDDRNLDQNSSHIGVEARVLTRKAEQHATERRGYILRFLLLNVIVHLFFENLQRQRAILEHRVVKLALIEFVAELLLRAHRNSWIFNIPIL